MRCALACSLLAALIPLGCKRSGPPIATPSTKKTKVGVVTDVGGRGDQSFNDSALRGLELWAGGGRYTPGGYLPLADGAFRASIPADLAGAAGGIAHLGIEPVVIQAKSQEDYEPDLQLAVDDGCGLTVGVGFMLENAVEAVAKRNPGKRFLLVDSQVLDEKNNPYVLPNVRTVTFREQEGSFLAGVLAGLATQTSKLGFVGGMELPLIKKFEAGFRAGVRAVNPGAQVLVGYTGSFDNANAGKQTAQGLLAQGVDIVFQAAGADGLGAIESVKEARAGGKKVYVIGVDSDQSHLAPEAVLTSMVKHVDLAVYRTIQELQRGAFQGGDVQWGLKEGGVGLAPVRIGLPRKAEILATLDAYAKAVGTGSFKVPATMAELASFAPPSSGVLAQAAAK